MTRNGDLSDTSLAVATLILFALVLMAGAGA